MNTTYTHAQGRTKKTTLENEKNRRAGNLSGISAITDKAASARGIFDV